MGLRVAAFVQRLREPEGENHEDGSCCCHSCDGDRSPRSGEGEAGAIGAPARLSVVGATRLLPRLPSEGLVPRRRLVSGPQVQEFAWLQDMTTKKPDRWPGFLAFPAGSLSRKCRLHRPRWWSQAARGRSELA